MISKEESLKDLYNDMPEVTINKIYDSIGTCQSCKRNTRCFIQKAIKEYKKKKSLSPSMEKALRKAWEETVKGIGK